MSAFDQLAARLGQEKGVTNPKGLAYAIGKKKFGASKMSQAAAQGGPAASIKQKGPGPGGPGPGASSGY